MEKIVHKTLLLIALFAIILSTHSVFSEEYTEKILVSETNQKIVYQIYINNTNIGTIELRTSASYGIQSDIVLTYYFNKLRISALLGNNSVFLVTISYKMTALNRTFEGYITREDLANSFHLSYLITTNDLARVTLDKLKIVLTGTGDSGEFVVKVNANENLVKKGKNYFIYGLEKHLFTIRKDFVDKGWINYIITTGQKNLGLIKIVASESFNQTNYLRIYFDSFDPEFSKMVMLEIRGTIKEIPTGKSISINQTLMPDHEYVLPTHHPLLEQNKQYEIESLNLTLRIPNYMVKIKVVEDTGPIKIVPPPPQEPSQLAASIIDKEYLGNGWFLVLVGINNEFDPSKLHVRFEGNQEILFTRTSVIENAFYYPRVLCIFLPLLYNETFYGNLTIMLETSTLAPQKTTIPLFLNGKDIAAIKDTKTLNSTVKIFEKNTILQMELNRLKRILNYAKLTEQQRLKYKMEYALIKSELEKYYREQKEMVIRIFANQTVTPTTFLIIKINTSIVREDPDKPITVFSQTNYAQEKLKAQYSYDYYFLYNTTNQGIIRVPPYISTDTLLLTYIVTLDKEYNSNNTNIMDTIDIHFKNAKNITINKIEIKKYEIISPPVGTSLGLVLGTPIKQETEETNIFLIGIGTAAAILVIGIITWKTGIYKRLSISSEKTGLSKK